MFQNLKQRRIQWCTRTSNHFERAGYTIGCLKGIAGGLKKTSQAKRVKDHIEDVRNGKVIVNLSGPPSLHNSAKSDRMLISYDASRKNWDLSQLNRKGKRHLMLAARKGSMTAELKVFGNLFA